MNKTFKRVVCLLFAAVMVLGAVGCTPKDDTTGGNPSNKNYTYDPETRPLTFAVGALDGNFNPFFYTSANDGSVISMTQISMMTTDSDGNLVCGDDYATVSLAYKLTMYDANGNVTASGDNDGYSEYEFVIKNGIKFSDGVDLTIEDVLFNLYVYLDPMYTGSSTIYSTNIQGLKAYQAQDPFLTDDSNVDYSSTFAADGQQRMNNLLEYLTEKDVEKTAQIAADIAKTLEKYKEELASDWTTVAEAGMESYKDDYSFTELWQAYLFNEGVVTVQTEMNANGVTVKKKDANGKYLTSLDEANNELANEMAAALTADKISAYASANGVSEDVAKEALMKEKAIEIVYTANTSTNSSIATVLMYWATGSTMLEEFTADAMSKHFEENGGKVDSISGISTYKTSTFDGKDLGEEHDVLKIRINGIDPKAIWNFSFVVAPKHYYSDEAWLANYDGAVHYGVAFANKTFFDEVLKDSNKNGLPVGAGVYKATDAKSSTTADKSTFFNNNYVYFIRNDYFETVGKEINNAKIKLFRYKVVSSDNLVSALKTGEIDYGEPNAKQENISLVSAVSSLGYKTYRTGGYGYVGINPKYVPDIEVRQAIMKAMNTSLIISDYYTEQLGELIYVPMSSTSWAYPKDATKPYYAYTTSVDEIQDLVKSAGWKLNSNGIFEKDGKTLKLTFTIAGETVDHPAYTMFEQAAIFLNKCGFDVTVTTDVNALKKLTNGGLEVWAAAWSSAADPDMYQNYHKDSTASALKNWYCQGMLDDTTGQFDDEKILINKLADLIEEGRETNNRDERAAIYAEALDVVMQLATELPTYQRNDLAVYNTDVIDVNTLNQNPSYNEGVVSRIWEVDYN